MGAVTMDVGRKVVRKRCVPARSSPSPGSKRCGCSANRPSFWPPRRRSGRRVRPEDWVDGQFVALTQAAVVAMGIGTLVASALVAGRERFVSEPDLFPGTPVTPGDQAVGTVLGLVGPALVAAVAMAVVGARGALTDGFVRGQEGYTTSMVPPVVEWAQPVLLVVLAGVVGVIVAHLPRGRLAALVFLVPACFVAGTAGVWASEAMPLRVLHPLGLPTTSAGCRTASPLPGGPRGILPCGARTKPSRTGGRSTTTSTRSAGTSCTWPG